ncbi:MAG: acetate--CoA ligase family protein [Candidatus Shapirobacteria bacterium]|nr:acetate--CoA ligase family protein [Candidatus Shapirobacteria bacterium]
MVNLDKLFRPRSVAVIGASRNNQKVGHLVFKNLIESDFKGSVYPVNPKAKTVLNQPVFSSILDLPKKVDLAIVVVPANIVPTILEEIGQSGTKMVIIISAGFAESGPGGLENQEKLLAISQKYQLRILGPNCLGIINPSLNLNASWGEIIPKKGNIAFASQSGALAAPIIELANEADLGFSYFASLGNKADINEVDLLEFFNQDKQTSLVIAYLESFQEGQKLVDLAQKTTLKKPLVILKSGQTDQGARSAQSHTASLATPAKITKGFFNQTNIIGADNIRELINLTKLLNQLKNKKVGEKTVIITNAGGPGVLATDAIAKSNLSLTKISSTTKRKLIKLLPQETNLDNPIDLLGNADENTYYKASKIVLSDPEVDNLIIILTKQRGTKVEAIAQKITQMKTKKIIIPIFMGGKSIKKARKIFQESNLINFPAPQDAITSLAKIINYQKRLKVKTAPNKAKINSQKIKKILTQKNKLVFNEAEGFEILSACQINTPRFIVFGNQGQGLAALEKIKFPAFLKILSTEIAHKTDLGAVQKINSEKEFLKHSNIMNKKFNHPEFILAEAVNGEIELIIGVKKDYVFGHLLMVGAGGIYAEIWQDQSFRVLPIKKNDAREMLSELKIYPILKGARGKKTINLIEIEKALLSIAKLAESFPEIDQLDINPLIADSKTVVAVDIKISLS